MEESEEDDYYKESEIDTDIAHTGDQSEEEEENYDGETELESDTAISTDHSYTKDPIEEKEDINQIDIPDHASKIKIEVANTADTEKDKLPWPKETTTVPPNTNWFTSSPRNYGSPSWSNCSTPPGETSPNQDRIIPDNWEDAISPETASNYRDIFFRCPEKKCNRPFGSLDTLQDHTLDSHNKEVSNNGEYKCSDPDCSQTYKSSNVVRTHEMLSHRNRNIPKRKFRSRLDTTQRIPSTQEQPSWAKIPESRKW